MILVRGASVCHHMGRAYKRQKRDGLCGHHYHYFVVTTIATPDSLNFDYWVCKSNDCIDKCSVLQMLESKWHSHRDKV